MKEKKKKRSKQIKSKFDKQLNINKICPTNMVFIPEIYFKSVLSNELSVKLKTNFNELKRIKITQK